MNPIQQFQDYWRQAHRKKDPVADSVALATVDAQGKPHVRTVLLKTFKEAEIGFVTRIGGEKIGHIQHLNDVECCLSWPTLSLQVRMRCTTTEMEGGILNMLWSLRPRDAKIMYHLGLKQSVVIPSYQFLVSQFNAMKAKWKGEKEIPRSKFYIGYVLHPYQIEFLHHKLSRLNRRELHEKTEKGWTHTTLAP